MCPVLPTQRIWRFFFDADNTHDPDYAADFIATARSADLVIASRFVKGSHIAGFPAYRKFLSRGASLLFRMALPFRLHDYTSGFRCYRVSLLQALLAEKGARLITRRGFECQVELLSSMPESTRIAELAHTLNYGHRVGGSKINLLKTITRTFTLFLRILWHRISTAF